MKIICPECGACLDSNETDFIKHAVSHWGVLPRDLDGIRNSEAKRRYNVLIEAAKKADLEKDMIDPKIPDMKEHLKKESEK
jgi:hypothetical protein